MNVNYVITGLDIGNGYVKGRFQGENKDKINIDIPSCVAGLTTAPSVAQMLDDDAVDNIFDRMICSIASPSVAEKRYIVYGKDAIASGRSLTEFDIAASAYSKSQQDLSGILVLGAVAGAAFRNYYKKNHRLPSEVIPVKTVAALALPIDEYMEHKDEFAKKFLGTTHEVTIHNFDVPVHIQIEFINVNVLPEGVSAQFAIASKGVEFMQALLDDVRSHDPEALPGITAEDLLACQNTCGVDIGEGTVNMPVITDGRFNQIASVTLQKGYGSVLEQSIPRVTAAHLPFNTRKAIADLLQKPASGFNAKKQATCRDIINAESTDLVNDITRNISRVLASGGVEVIYVYGGGATPMKEALYQPLKDKTSEFSGGDAFPILYLDSVYARNLNREGLFNVALADYENFVNASAGSPVA